MNRESQPLLAAAWMLGAVVSFSAMAVAGREAGLTFDTFEIMTYRSAIGVAIMCVIVLSTGRMREIRTSRPGTHLARNIAHFTGQNLWFFALASIPLAQVFAIEFTTPLWVIIFAALFLGETLTRIKMLAGILGFIGVLIVLRPGASPLGLGHLSVAGAAIGFALTAICTKSLTRTESVMTIMFWLTVIQLLLGLVCGFLYDGAFTWPAGGDWIGLVVIALAGLAAHYCITTALSLAPASVVTPVDFIRLPAIAVIGMLFYDEPLSIAVIAGAALIFGANYLNVIAAQQDT